MKTEYRRHRMRVALVIVLAMIAAVATWWALSKSGSQRGRPHVILITVESVRTDHMASFGGERITCPNLDALAREGVAYDDAHTVTSWTLPAHASLFTGLYPAVHQTTGPESRLHDSYTTLAEILSEDGYQCAGIVSGPYLQKQHNLHQGFEYYDESPSEVDQERAHGDITNPEMAAALDDLVKNKRDSDRPLFLFAYFWDPHYDYIPPAPYNAMFITPTCESIDVTGYEASRTVHPDISEGQLEYVISQYDGELRCTDHYLGKFFALLKEKNLWDNSVIVVTSDHGEEFFDHGKKGHKNNLYAETIHVPLIVKYPKGGRSGRDPRLVSLVDIAPTILDLAGISVDVPLQGRSLLDSSPDPDRSIFCELTSTWFRRAEPGVPPGKRIENWLAIRKGDHKFIVRPERNRNELYDVRKDPTEQNNLYRRDHLIAQSLATTLNQWQDSMKLLAELYGTGANAELSPEQRDRLRSLGYLR